MGPKEATEIRDQRVETSGAQVMGLKEATRWKYLNKVLSLSKETTTNEKKKREEETGTTVGRQL